MTTKRQQTMAKITRERAVKEKRERKLEKKRERAAERKAKANGTWIAPDEPNETEDELGDEQEAVDEERVPTV
jgi:hypothetical protein